MNDMTLEWLICRYTDSAGAPVRVVLIYHYDYALSENEIRFHPEYLRCIATKKEYGYLNDIGSIKDIFQIFRNDLISESRELEKIIDNFLTYLDLIKEYDLKEAKNRMLKFILTWASAKERRHSDEDTEFFFSLMAFMYEDISSKITHDLEQYFEGLLVSYTMNYHGKDIVKMKFYVPNQDNYKIVSFQFNCVNNIDRYHICDYKYGDAVNYAELNNKERFMKYLSEKKIPFVPSVYNKVRIYRGYNRTLICLFNWYMYEYYAYLCIDKMYGNFILAKPDVIVQRADDNCNEKSFDFVSVRISINSRPSRKNKLKIIKEKKSIIDQLVLFSIRVCKQYSKYDVPVKCLHLTDIILRNNSILEYKFELKPGLLKLQKEWEEEEV